MEDYSNRVKDDFDYPLFTKNDAFINIIILIFFFIALISMGYIIYLLASDGGTCLLDPIEYYHSLGEDRCECLSGKGKVVLEYPDLSDAELKKIEEYDSGINFKVK